MPRRSTRTEVPEGERRVTRRSLQATKEPERSSPRGTTKSQAPKASPSPARGRGRGRSTGGRGRKGKKNEEEEEEVEGQDTAAAEDIEETSSETGAGDTVTKAGRGRGRRKGKTPASEKEPEIQTDEGKEDAPEESEENKESEKQDSEEKKEVKEDKEESESVTPSKRGRGRRSAGPSPAKAETPPSSGRSSRTRSPRKLPEETPTRRSGRSRKSAGNEEDTTPEKDEPSVSEEIKPSVSDETKKETSMEEEPKTEAPVSDVGKDQTPASEEMEDSTTGMKRKREDEETEVAEKKQKIEDSQSMSQKEEPMEVPKDTEDTPIKEPEPQVSEPNVTKDNEETFTAEDSTPKVEKLSKEVPQETEEKSETTTQPVADQEKPMQLEQEAMDTTSGAEEGQAKVTEQQPEPDINEYVMINKDEIPSADSAEVLNALPKEPVQESAQSPVKEPQETAVSPPSTTQVENKQDAPEATSQPVSVIQETAHAENAAGVSQVPAENGENGAENDANASIESANVNKEAPPQNTAAPSNNVDSVAQESGATIPDPLFQRQYVANTNIDSALAADISRKFSVVTYNILADCHAPLNKYPWITPDHLSQEYRHKKLLQELQHLDADVLCLQEVGSKYYDSTLKPTLGALGYEGSYFKRIDDDIDEGEATFVRSSRFTVLQHQGFPLRDLAFKELTNSALENENLDAVKRFVDKPSVILISQLRCNNTGKVITVGNIHVSWEQLAKPDLQCVEVADALKELVQTATPQGSFFICGDFNSWPGSPVYQLTKEGYLSDQSVSELQGVNNVRMADGSLSPLINLWWKGFQHTATNMKSAYQQVLGNEPHTTRYPHNGSVKQVDFIWYSGNTLEAAGVLQAVNQEHLPSGIPNATFPSDHVSLKSDLIFKF